MREAIEAYIGNAMLQSSKFSCNSKQICKQYLLPGIDLIKIGEETDVTLQDVVREHRDRDERNLENFYKVLNNVLNSKN